MPARRFLRSPYSTATGASSIALSVAACTFVFGILNGLLLTPLPYDEAEGLFLLRSRNTRLGETRPFVSVADFKDWQRFTSSFEGMALFHWTQLDLWGEGASPTERIQGLAVTPEFFSVMRITPSIGGLPEARSGAFDTETLVLGRPLWRRRFGADPTLPGKSIRIGSWRSLPEIGPVPYRVTGVVDGRSRFLPTHRGVGRVAVGVDDIVDFWVLLNPDEEPLPPREDRGLVSAVARLKPGVSPEAARAELEALAERLAARHPTTNTNWTVELVSLRDSIAGAIRPALWLLFGGVSLLFLISCSNLGSLELVRILERRRELAVRAALGASAGRLVRGVFLETSALAASGGILGVLLAAVGLRRFAAMAPPSFPRLEAVRLDSSVLLYAALLVGMAGLLAGLGPAWLLTRGPAHGALASGTSGASPESRRLLRAFAAAAVGMALALLIGAGLVHQSLSRLLVVDPGYDRTNLLTLTVSLPESRHPWRRNSEFVREVVERVSRLPGIVAAGGVRGVPGREAKIETPLFLDGSGSATDPLEARLRAQIRLVSRSYFEAMGIPILAGRGFEPRDERGPIGHTRVVLINETMAGRLWPNESPLGKSFHVVRRDLPAVEVVGVVGDVRYRGLEHRPGMEIYYPEALFPQAQADLVLRTATTPAGLARVVQAAIRDVEPDVWITRIGTMEDVLEQTVADRRVATWLLNGFSATALLLATVGVAGVMAQSVSQRRKELGVRLALGARPSTIMRMVLARSLSLVGLGIALGLLTAGASAGLLSRFLFAIEPTDAATHAAAALATATLAMLASLVPALRAARTDPLRVLRQD